MRRSRVQFPPRALIRMRSSYYSVVDAIKSETDSFGLIIMDRDEFQTEVLEVARSAQNYRKWICRLTFPYLGDNAIELGSGLGDHATEWLRMGAKKITLLERSPTRVDALERLFTNDARVSVQKVDSDSKIRLEKLTYSCFISLNVLEHINDDKAVFEAAYRALRDDGVFVAFVPAHNFLFSRFDKKIGHLRRYSKGLMRRRMIDAGFKIEEIHYVNFAGWFAWLIGMRILRLNPEDGILLTFWDRVIVPLSSVSEKLITPPFGQSIIAIGMKK